MVPVALKSSQPGWRSLIRPMLLLSLGLHGLLFLLPTSPVHKPEPPAEEKVSLTQLPAESPPASPAAATRPTPAPTPRAVATPPARTIAPLPRRSNAPPPLQTAATPRPAAATAQPRPAATTPATTNPATTPPADPFAVGFPIYPGAVRGSFEGLPAAFAASGFRTGDTLSAVGDFFANQPAVNGFTFTPLGESTGERQVYEVTKGSETRYLTLLSNPNGSGTAYVVTREALPDDVNNQDFQDPDVSTLIYDVSSVIAGIGISLQDIATVLNGDPTALPPVPATTIDALLSNYADFFTSDEDNQPQNRAGIIQSQVGTGTPEQIIDGLRSQPEITSGQITLAEAGSYGGGTLYSLSRSVPNKTDPVTVYLSLVPTNDGRTLFTVWDRRPPES